MSERSTSHATFVIERIYDARPARVFAAWADPRAKASWFGPAGEASKAEHSLQFEVAGSEHLAVLGPGGSLYTFDARYHDIVPDRRIVYAYEMHRDHTRISVSLATVEFEPAANATRLTFTEQGVFLDGHDTPAEREHGTAALLDGLKAHLERRAESV